MPLHNDNHRLNPRRDDEQGKHDDEVPPECMLYTESQEGAFLAPHPPDDRHAEPQAVGYREKQRW